MSMLIALAISISLLAVAATWLFLVPLALLNAQVWQGFVAWACHYHSGGKITGTRTTVICMSFGAVVGLLSVLLAGQLGILGAFAAPLAVGIGAAAIVLAAHLPWLSTIPASVYGFACIAGLILLGGGDITPAQALLPTILSIVVGAGFGYVSEAAADMLVKKSTPAESSVSRAS